MKFRPLFFVISLSLIILSIYSIARWQFRQSIDFAGGTVWEIRFSQFEDKSKLEKVFSDNNVPISSLVQNGDTYQLKLTANLSQEQKNKLDSEIRALDSNYQELKFETLGPSLGRELLRKTLFAIVLAAISLLIFIGSRFNDFSFGVSAVLAMFHDAFILIGSFSILGHFFGAELDSLFVTALLTTLSASVHDTVVTFDRIRELKLHGGIKFNWVDLANRAVNETIVRSINNSMTVIFMLFALVLLGGSATRWFAAALLIGVVCGTYSSTGVAIPLVLMFKRLSKKA